MKEGFIFSWFNYFYYKVYKDEFVTNYYRLIVRFSPSCNVIDYCTTMASADFSR